MLLGLLHGLFAGDGQGDFLRSGESLKAKKHACLQRVRLEDEVWMMGLLNFLDCRVEEVVNL